MVELHLLKKCIRLLRIKHLIAGHHCDQILCVRQVDNFMRPSWNHINRFNAIYADKKNTWIKTGPRTGFHPSSRRTAYDGKVWKRKSGDGIRDSTHQSRIPKIPPPQIHSSPKKSRDDGRKCKNRTWNTQG